MDTPPNEKLTALERIQVPEIIDLAIIEKDIGPSIDLALQKAAKIAVSITDDPSRELAIDAVEKIKDDCIMTLEEWRKDFYIPKYRETERLRELFDPRIKQAKAVVKTIMGHVSDYNIREKRKADLAHERAEAEARRLREEAERRQREAEEAERKAKEAAEAEKRRIQEAKDAEERRIQAEKEAKERQEREAREAAAAEIKRKREEEEVARLEHAEVADEVGNGPEKVDTILENTTPISPVLAKPEQTKDDETLRLEKEQAEYVAKEKVEREKAAQEEAEKKRLAAEKEAKAKREEADRAVAAATSSAAAAASTAISTRSDPRTMKVVRWKYDLDSDGTASGDREAVMKLVKAVAAGDVPVEFLGYDNDHPEKFRPPAIQEAVNNLKDRFACPGIRAYPQNDEQLKRRKVGGRR